MLQGIDPLQFAGFDLELELRHLRGILALVHLGVDQRNLSLIAGFGLRELALERLCSLLRSLLRRLFFLG
ncbi:hypothetical protein D9M69_499190 [compost metagenome]